MRACDGAGGRHATLETVLRHRLRGKGLLVASLLLLGCGDDDDDAACVEGRTVSCPCPGGATGVQACLDDGIFGPCECPAGGPDGRFDSALFAPGERFSHTFDAPGTFEYFCVVHPWQTGTVVVQDP